MTFNTVVLPYSFAALEPYIDQRTMEVHYGKHYTGYTAKLNDALEGYDDLTEMSIEDLLGSLKDLPDEIQTAVMNNGGGYANHTLFFSTLKMNEGGEPIGDVAEMITEEFGSFESFKEEFSKAAKALFASGWAFLALDSNGDNPHISALPNQESPLMSNHIPLLGLDVWEHAYYLNYQNRRPDYVDAFWNIIDWEKVEELYQVTQS